MAGRNEDGEERRGEGFATGVWQPSPVLALEEEDWLFPTYRDSMGLVTRGIDPVEVLTLLRGDWHCGYDPTALRTAPPGSG